MHDPSRRPRFHFAYAFERFPSFTQTFCAREVLELRRLGVRPLIFSIHDTRDEEQDAVGAELMDEVCFLPPRRELVEQVEAWKDARALPQEVVLTLRHWGRRPDKTRVYEAAFIGKRMQEAGVRHVHTHFAGIGARTCWWTKFFFDCTYSFTGHANDLFCPASDSEITLDILVGDASLVVAVSDFTREWLARRFPTAAARIRRVYNGLDCQAFAPIRPLPRPANPPRLLSVGRLIEKKGFDTLIEACSRLHRQGTAFQCGIVGEGPLEADLRRQITAAGLDHHVELLGPRAFNEVLDLLGQASIFVLACQTEPDGGRDVLPTVIMEAMAAGLPCVSTPIAGVPEMVADSITGLLVPERNPTALADALTTLLANPEQAATMGHTGAAIASDRFDKSVTTRRLICELAASGLVNRDPHLLANAPTLRHAYRRQSLLRLQRLVGIGRRHRRPGIVPDEVKLK